MNNLKVSASRMAEVVARALGVWHRRLSQRHAISVGRHLQDAHGATLSFNDRVYAANAAMLLVRRSENAVHAVGSGSRR
jgi:hypothetical protein